MTADDKQWQHSFRDSMGAEQVKVSTCGERPGQVHTVTPRILQREEQGQEKWACIFGVTAGHSNLGEGVMGHRCFRTYCWVPCYCDGGDGRTSSAAPNRTWCLNTRGQTQRAGIPLPQATLTPGSFSLLFQKYFFLILVPFTKILLWYWVVVVQVFSFFSLLGVNLCLT